MHWLFNDHMKRLPCLVRYIMKLHIAHNEPILNSCDTLAFPLALLLCLSFLDLFLVTRTTAAALVMAPIFPWFKYGIT